jgi:hypothetical protein
MRSRKLTSPLSWFFEPKTTISDLYHDNKPFTYIKEHDIPASAIFGKRINSISNWSCCDGPFGAEWITWPTTYSFTASYVPKKTLKISKKEDIKFAY